MKRLIGIIAVGALFAGTAVANVQDADADKVANCAFVADVSGKTQSGHALGARRAWNRRDAAKAGATHVVWDKVTSASVERVTGKAYKCGK